MTGQQGLSADEREKWRREAEAHPSGQRCDGIHDATADRRVIVLLNAYDAAIERVEELEARLAHLTAERDALAGKVRVLHAKYHGRANWVGYEQARREARDEIERDLRAALNRRE